MEEIVIVHIVNNISKGNMIYVLVGPIASGKSTYCKRKAQEGALIVNDDSIVNALHADQYGAYDKDLKPLYKSLEMSIIAYAVAVNRDVVVDRPSYKRTTRRRYIEMAHSIDAEVTAIIFENFGPEVHAKRRFESDSRGYTYEGWLRVAKEHESLREPVDVHEGFDHIEYIRPY